MAMSNSFMLDKKTEYALWEHFKYLTSDINNLKSKEWIKRAIVSHSKRSFPNLKETDIEISLDIWWNRLEK